MTSLLDVQLDLSNLSPPTVHALAFDTSLSVQHRHKCPVAVTYPEILAGGEEHACFPPPAEPQTLPPFHFSAMRRPVSIYGNAGVPAKQFIGLLRTCSADALLCGYFVNMAQTITEA